MLLILPQVTYITDLTFDRKPLWPYLIALYLLAGPTRHV